MIAHPSCDPDCAAMLRQFEETPGDLTAYGVMADRLDELGMADLAHAYRWMSRRGRYPHQRTRYIGDMHQRKVPERFRWAWYAMDAYDEKHGGRREVPGVLPASRLRFHSLPALVMVGEQRVYRSHDAAVDELAFWLKRLKDAYSVEVPS